MMSAARLSRVMREELEGRDHKCNRWRPHAEGDRSRASCPPPEPPLMRKRADIVLVERGFFASRARAQAAIAAGLVSIGGVALKKASEEVAGDAPIEVQA